VILTSEQIDELGIVGNSSPDGKRATTYDATVGVIISKGIIVEGDSYILPRSGIVWVISNETFKLPVNVTGLATLRTTWTHDGVLALNVGIIDPNYDGPLATALVNFGDRGFPINKNATFLRVLFQRHDQSNAELKYIDRNIYINSMKKNSISSSDTFLNITSIATEVIDQIFDSPRWISKATSIGLLLSAVGVLVAVISIFFPVAYGISGEFLSSKSELSKLRNKVDAVASREAADSKTLADMAIIEAARSRKLNERDKGTVASAGHENSVTPN
jgi:deoxycytidine triphosphate deaminase